MATVIVQAVASLDGFIARPDDLPGPIFDWYEAGDVELRFNPDHVFHVSQPSADYLDHSQVRCQVIGRTLFDFVDGWGGLPIVGDHVFVVTHRDADEWRQRHPDAPYTFCTDGVEDAIRRATEHAGDGSVVVCAGEVGGQVVAAGLADELAIDLAPVFLGRGKKFLGSHTDELVLDDAHVVVQGERVLHLRYHLRG
ncbi:dihydrofolate reductase family protein [Nocardioides cynanchi]|uniref:dihydrofolate reductase family protein n=1 Tax=Nocardioides cynanchi TaxID=2558918 RepID=UPI00124803BA|nr:dihydrofolate reductase [Nocardioides cynanchi]